MLCFLTSPSVASVPTPTPKPALQTAPPFLLDGALDP